jgi:hypothetical protein
VHDDDDVHGFMTFFLFRSRTEGYKGGCFAEGFSLAVVSALKEYVQQLECTDDP